MATVEVRVLGRPAVLVDHQPVSLTGRLLILAVRLAVASPRGVSAQSLEHDLWSDENGSAGAVRVALTRLRQALGESVISRFDTSYAFVDLDLDSWRFERSVRAARDRGSSVEARLGAYAAALESWTGPAFEGFDDFVWAAGEAQRLNELREIVIDERFDLLLDHGHHTEAIADLSDAHARQPTREHRTGLLALALYQSGRHSQALSVIAATKRALREELGLFSGPELDELELRVLQHDPALAVPAMTRRSNATVEVDSRIRAATTLCRAAAYTDAVEILDEAENIAVEAGNRRALALVQIERARCAMLSGTGDPHPLLDEAKAIGRELRDGRVLARSALVRAGSGVPPQRSTALLELMEPIELLPADDPDAIHLLCFAAIAVTVLDTSEAAIHLLDEAERLCAAGDSRAFRVVLDVAKSLCGGLRGEPIAISSGLATASLEEARTLRDPLLVAIACMAAIRCRYAVGDVAGVESVLGELTVASQAAMLPFGTIRVHLCETMNTFVRGNLDQVPSLIERENFEGVRLATHVVHAATQTHQLLLAYEMDRWDEIASVARVMAVSPGAPRTWAAVLAACRDEAAGHELLSVARSSLDSTDLTDNDLATFLAFAAEVAQTRGDAALGRWCATRLDSRSSDGTLMSGLGTMVLGFVDHFGALAHLAFGDVTGGRDRLEHAVDRASEAQAWLWHAHSSVELAHLLAGADNEADVEHARNLLDSVDASPVTAQSMRVRRRVGECRVLLSATHVDSTF